ncbi:MAG: 5-methyltetrahydropteroyltriglutamate--homocysteine S-methyltransferase [Endomicrobia bacterium]|nr:5-methyltetrahydropteroyltriglutamate--homocysteine S-methyltransferase [Endomicrobiia bacterium]
MKTYAYGFPRIGFNKEYKIYIEKFWKEEISEEELIKKLTELEKNIVSVYQKYIEVFPHSEMTFYNEVLDTAILFGLYNPKNLKEYYELCRGEKALELKKWFNTNYHYIVCDFKKLNKIEIFNNIDNISLVFKRNSKFPHIIGPFTFLKLSKGLNDKKFREVFFEMIYVLNNILKYFNKVQIDEPAFSMELTREEIDIIKEGYKKIDSDKDVYLITYYDDIDFIEELYDLPVKGIGIDFVRGKNTYEKILKIGFPQHKTLIAGIIDGRNIWRSNFNKKLDELRLLSKVTKDIMISNGSPLYHLPLSIQLEKEIPDDIKECISFAVERLNEIKLTKEYFLSNVVINQKPIDEILFKYRKEKIFTKEKIVEKKPSYEERREAQSKILNLPLFPTTTIGSFPQTQQIREKRKQFLENKLTSYEYEEFIFNKIKEVIKFQEDIGLDVLVHGEFERTDMVEFFAFKLEGFLTTKNGWVISYGTRIYRPPIIYGDIIRKKPLTLNEILFAQSQTNKPVKGMLTGPVTMVAWSFCRDDIPLKEVAYQIAKAIREEILEYEKNGIKIVQIDEPAFREKAPIKKRNWDDYFEWAVEVFNLATNTDFKTQIHTHMCYSNFSDIIKYINRLDFDVISIENARSKGDIINEFKDIGFNRQIGIGVWDIHSPYPPKKEDILEMLENVLKVIPKQNIWINPDCGLKTRSWQEIEQPLKTLVEVANFLRGKNSL